MRAQSASLGRPRRPALQSLVVLADFLIHNTSEVLTCAGPAPRRGAAQGDAGSRPGAVVAALDGRIVFVGSADDWRRDRHARARRPHARRRRRRARPRLRRRRTRTSSLPAIGATSCGGASPARPTRRSPPGAAASSAPFARRARRARPSLAADTRRRLDEMLRAGTTTCEAKSGYGLTTASELKMLRVIASLARDHAIEVVADVHGRARDSRRVPRSAAGVRRSPRARDDPGRRLGDAGRVVRRVLRDRRVHAGGVARDSRRGATRRVEAPRARRRARARAAARGWRPRWARGPRIT